MALKVNGNNKCLMLLPEARITGRVEYVLTSSGQELLKFAWFQKGNPPEIYLANRHLDPIGLVVVVEGSLRAVNCESAFQSESTEARLYLLNEGDMIRFECRFYAREFYVQGYAKRWGRNQEFRLVSPQEYEG